MSNLPDVKSYLSVHLFLQDIYAFRKRVEKKFSYEVWAEELGIPSKSSLRFAVLGKRKISDKLAEKFCVNLNLPSDEREYFILLVSYTQATAAEKKRAYGQRLTQHLKALQNSVTIEPSDDLLFDPVVMALRNLLSFNDIARTPQNLAYLLEYPEDKIADYLSKLQGLELAEFQGEEWNAKQDSVRINNKPNSEAILQYHKLSLQKAIQAQATTTAEERHYYGSNIAMSPEEFREVSQEIRSFFSQVFAKYNKQEFSNRRLYQINMNMIPLTIPSGNILSEVDSGDV